jgi:hypothetical protein
MREDFGQEPRRSFVLDEGREWIAGLDLKKYQKEEEMGNWRHFVFWKNKEVQTINDQLMQGPSQSKHHV